MRHVCTCHIKITQLTYFMLQLAGCIYGAYAAHALFNIIYLQNTLNSKKKLLVYAPHMHKAQRGQKISIVRKVLTTLNFLTTPGFSVTTPSCEPDGVHIVLARNKDKVSAKETDCSPEPAKPSGSLAMHGLVGKSQRCSWSCLAEKSA